MSATSGARAALVALTGCAVLPVSLVLAPGVPQAVAAGTRAPVEVSIAGDDPSGEVRSPRRSCKAGVTVRLVRQVGARGGGDDRPTGLSDTTGLQGGRWTYDFGNPGLDDGRYYALVPGSPRCRAATSRTLIISRADG